MEKNIIVSTDVLKLPILFGYIPALLLFSA